MRQRYLIGFLLLLAIDTFAQIAFKFAGLDALPMSGDGPWLARLATTPWLYGAVCGYVAAFLTWMALLETAPVGPAFAASHLEVVTVTLLAVPLFGETVGWTQIAGACLIVAGIACLAISESDDEPAPAPSR